MSWLTANGPRARYPDSWYAASLTLPEPRPALAGDIRTETCVIGAGYTGLSAARALAEAGRDVVVLEAGRIGWGASGRNGGQVGIGFNWSMRDLEAHLGRETALSLWDLSLRAVGRARSLISEDMPETDFHPGILNAAWAQADAQEIAGDLRHLQDRYGYREGTLLSADEVASITGSGCFAGGALDMLSGYTQPLAMALGLGRFVLASGAEVFETTEALSLEPGRIETANGVVRCDHIVLACNGLQSGLVPKLGDYVLPINNFIATTEPLGPDAPMTAPHAVTDSRTVVNYWWQSADGRLNYGGGESYGQRFPKEIVERVRKNLSRVYPHLSNAGIDYAWGGTLAVTATRLPFVEEILPRVWTAAGYSGHGVALSLECGAALGRAILGDKESFELLRQLPTPRLPGGRHIGQLLTTAGMMTGALSDRLRLRG